MEEKNSALVSMAVSFLLGLMSILYIISINENKELKQEIQALKEKQAQ